MGTLSHRNKMARGPKRHLKRLSAPKHWMLDKMGGTWAPRPSTGPHKMRECLPLILVLRNRLKYALTAKECKTICMNRLIKVDGKVTSIFFLCTFTYCTVFILYCIIRSIFMPYPYITVT